MENTTVNEGKTIAIICYITIVGTIVAFIMNSSSKNSFASFHIRQMLGISLLALINNWLIGRMAGLGMASLIIFLGISALWVIGLISAIQGEEKSVPLLGDQFQNWFKTI